MKICFGLNVAVTACCLALMQAECAALQTNPWQGPAFPEAEPVPLYVVPPALAQVYKSADPIALLAFSADHQMLAFSTSHNSKRQSELGDIWLSELYVWSFPASDSPRKLIDATTTAKFAHYGAPALSLAWQHNNILMVIGDGDDEATQLTYLTATQQLANPNFAAWTLDEPPAITAAERQVQQCFTDWPAEVINSSNSHWLQPDQTLLYQADYYGVSRDLWLIDVANCQRTVLPLPKELAAQQVRLLGAALYHNQLVLALQPRHQQPSQTLLLQTDVSRLGTAQQQWLNWSYGLGSSLEFTPLMSTGAQSLFLLTDNQQPCRSRLYSLNQQQLSAVTVDGHQLCNATVSQNGQLALALSARTRKHNKVGAISSADRIWVVSPGFLAALAR